MNEWRMMAAGIATALLVQTASAGVIVVDEAGGGQFTSLPAAVAAAQDGDTLLVKAGAYSGFTLIDKSLSVVSENGAVVNVLGQVQVQNLSADRTVVLKGLRVTGTGVSDREAALYLFSNEGAVRAQDCSFTGANWIPGFSLEAGIGARVDGNTTGAAFVACEFRGGNVGLCHACVWGIDGGPGLQVWSGLNATDSRAALYDCEVFGGDGSYGNVYEGGNGGAGARLYSGAFLHASGSSFQGGDGGDACDALPVQGGNGGAGILKNGNTITWLVESSAVGGTPGVAGPSSSCFGSAGNPGQPFAGNGALYILPVLKLEMEATALVREGNDVLLTFRGEPGVQVYLFVSEATTFWGAASWRGIRLTKKVGMLEHVMVLGAMPPSGVLTAGFHIPDLPPGIAADALFLQAWGRGPGGRVLGSFTPLTVLDSAY